MNVSKPKKPGEDDRDRDRKFILLAIIACLLICGAIVSYYYWQNQKNRHGAGYATARVAPTEPLPPLPPVPTPAPKETKEPPKIAPTQTAPQKSAGPKPTAPRTHSLAPPDFVYRPLPYDAPLAEFPIVLVWQKRREWYRPPGGKELPITPPPFSVVPKPPHVPPTIPPTIPPTEQSPSGL